MADRRLAEPERFGQVADARLVSGLRLDQAQEPKPCRVGDHLERRGEPLCGRGGQRFRNVERNNVKLFGVAAVRLLFSALRNDIGLGEAARFLHSARQFDGPIPRISRRTRSDSVVRSLGIMPGGYGQYTLGKTTLSVGGGGAGQLPVLVPGP